MTMTNKHVPGWFFDSLSRRSTIGSVQTPKQSSPSNCRRIQPLDILPPLVHVWPEKTSVVRQQAVHFAFDISRLCPDAAAASIAHHLVVELGEQETGAVVVGSEVGVDFVCLVDGVDCLLDIPKTDYRVLAFRHAVYFESSTQQRTKLTAQSTRYGQCRPIRPGTQCD